MKIVNEINSKKDYYTTSSCSGRIVLLEMKFRKKNQCSWIFTKHGKATFIEIAKSLKINKKINKIWLKQEPVILHVRCKNLDSAKKLLDVSRKIFKRAGIISLSDKKIVIEIIGSDRLETIIADKNFVADEKYVKQLVKYANKNFEENKRKIQVFLGIVRGNI